MSNQMAEKAVGVISVTSPKASFVEIAWSVTSETKDGAQARIKKNYTSFSKAAKANGMKLIGKPHL